MNTPAQLSSSSLLWKQLMDNGIFDDCYPQRLNASFHYLCSDNYDNTTFSLKDLIQKGPFVFTYLSIDVDKDSSFAIMDIFRTFDRSGRGSVFLEEFVLGVLERLNAIKRNTVLLENIAEDLLSIESRCTELATLLEKERVNNSMKFTNYNRNLKALSTIIRPYIRSSKATQYLSALDTPGLIRIFEQSIIHAAAEVQVFFHIPDSRITGALSDLTVQRDHLKLGNQLRMIWNVSGTSSPSSSANPSSSSGVAGDQSNAMTVNDNNDPSSSSSNSRAIAMNRSAARGGEESELWLKDSPEAMISNILSGVDENRFKRLRFDGSHNNQMQSQQEMMYFLKDLLPAEALAMLESGYIADNVQLHVLQDAFICINNFFQLQHPHMTLLSLPDETSDEPKQGQSTTNSSPSRYNHNSNHSQSGFGAPNSPNKATKKKAEISMTLKLHEYRELLGLNQNKTKAGAPSSSLSHSHSHSSHSQPSDNPDVTESESTVLIAVLAEDLLRTQDTLQRTQQRLKIFELIQSDMMAQHYRLEEEDKVKEQQRSSGLAAMFNTQNHNSNDNHSNSEGEREGRGGGSSNNGEEDHSHTSSFHSATKKTISERINNHNPRFHRQGGEGRLGEEESDEEEVIRGGSNHSGEDDDRIALHHEDTVTYEEILKELASLETCLAERSRTDYALGMLLDRPITMLDDNATIAIHAQQTSTLTNTNHTDSNASLQNTAAILDSTNNLAEKIGEEMKGYLDLMSKRDLLTMELRNKEELLTEYRTKMEQIDIERSEWISLNAELQILREKLQKHQKEEHTSKILEQKNQELAKKVSALEDQLHSFQEIDKKYQQQTNNNSNNNSNNIKASQGKSSSNENSHPSNYPSSSSSSSGLRQSGLGFSSEEFDKLRDAMQQAQSANLELNQQNEQYQKEIQRLKTTINLSEQRVKSILQDSMVLHQNIQMLEEENMNSKATVTKLLREVEDMKNLRQYKEESERRLFEYQKEVMKFEVELAESRENNIIINKYHGDLITAERTIESLEQKLAEYSVELEKGKIASSQLDNYREGMKAKLQEIRDLSLYIHQLENQLKDVPYLNARYQELSVELADSKVKVDKIPGLLAEIARLRGSSRASIKALMEQDKLISTMKNRLKLLEKDNTLLKHENQALLDLEMKVKEANQEIKRLMNIITDLQGSAGDRERGDRGGGGGSSHGYGERGGGHMAHKAMSIMMLNKFTSSAHALDGDESSHSNNSPNKTATLPVTSPNQNMNMSAGSISVTGSNANNLNNPNNSSARKMKKYSQASIILPMSPLSRVNSAAGSGSMNSPSNLSEGSGMGEGGGGVSSLSIGHEE